MSEVPSEGQHNESRASVPTEPVLLPEPVELRDQAMESVADLSSAAQILATSNEIQVSNGESSDVLMQEISAVEEIKDEVKSREAD